MPNSGILLEIAAHSLTSANAAREGGADRIELCAALQTGGLTPGPGLLELVTEQVDLPVHVLIRPRLGDFVYSDEEIKTMCTSIKWMKQLRADGVVIGCLNDHREINQHQLATLVQAAEGLDLTFHRCFDLLRDPLRTTETLIAMGIDRILTSGQAASAWRGQSLIRDLVREFGGEITIMPGAGVKSSNVKALLQFTGCTEVHASAKQVTQPIHEDALGITTVNATVSQQRWDSDVNEVSLLRKQLGPVSR